MAGLNIRDSVRKYGPEYLAICGLAKYFPTMNSESSVFFVNSNSSDSNDSDGLYGQFPENPLETITQAITNCTTNKNDYIFIMDYYQGTGETWPISINKGMIHIIGISNPAVPWPWVDPTGDTAAFSFTTAGAYGEIAGLDLGGGTNYACLSVDTSGLWGNWIHHCNLGHTQGMAGEHGISTPAGEMIHWLVEHCKFGKSLTADGIEIPTNAGPNSVRGTVIRNNLFRVSGVGINVLDTTGDFDEGGIFDNRFVMSADTDGKGIDFASGAVGFVDGNVGVMEDGAAPTNNPFKDAGTGMGWG
ncbi:MAG: hypothetical protein ACYS30_22935, partial [Planctomycetota bacterium]